MSNFTDIKFATSDVIKGLGALIFIGSMWADLKSDQVRHQEEHVLINYRIKAIERCCNVAVKPDDVKIKETNTPEF